MLSPKDVVLRAHTGSGKSFAVLLALLARPRLLFQSRSGAEPPVPGISALVIVPSNELAYQYMRWAHELMPAQLSAHMDAVIQCVVRGEATMDAQMTRLRETPPHVLIGTPTRLQECFAMAQGAHLLGLHTWRTLVLDEADALLNLPGRFPSEKQRWKHLTHPSPGLHVLDTIMRSRATFSGGERLPNAGMESYGPKRGADRRPPEPIRRTQYKGVENTTDHAPALARGIGIVPLQLVCTSATANSVLRHFLSARTGWLRTNTRETRDSAQWIDLTGQSGQLSAVGAPYRGMLPRELTHSCVVVDEVHGSPQPRLLDTTRGTAAPLALRKPASTSTTPAIQEHVVDLPLLEMLAYLYASEHVRRGLALIPARWSVQRVHDELAALGVPVKIVASGQIMSSSEDAMYVLQSTSARGLDIPNMSHVFLVGLQAVRDSLHYTHAAGRVARIGPDGQRPRGHVVTLIRGNSAAEQKMSQIYKRVGVELRPLQLRSLSL